MITCRILKLRDSNSEMPADFGTYLNKWALESITAITINHRLGLLNNEGKGGEGRDLIDLVRRFIEVSEMLEAQPPLWKIYSTKSFKELMSILDGITK